jgi:hypothetical protein
LGNGKSEVNQTLAGIGNHYHCTLEAKGRRWSQKLLKLGVSYFLLYSCPPTHVQWLPLAKPSQKSTDKGAWEMESAGSGLGVEDGDRQGGLVT